MTQPAPLEASRVQPGLVVRLDTDALRAAGGSLTNAQATPEEDRAVRGVHDFLVVALDARAGTALAVPLFARSAPGSAPLDDRLRTGPAEWLAAPVHYSRWQHWRIPLGALVTAAVEAGEPRAYATGNVDVLRALENWATRNRCAFRAA